MFVWMVWLVMIVMIVEVDGGLVKNTRNMSSKFYPGFIPIYGYVVSGVECQVSAPPPAKKNGLSNRKRN
jgi:hypothetical protein